MTTNEEIEAMAEELDGYCKSLKGILSDRDEDQLLKTAAYIRQSIDKPVVEVVENAIEGKNIIHYQVQSNNLALKTFWSDEWDNAKAMAEGWAVRYSAALGIEEAP